MADERLVLVQRAIDPRLRQVGVSGGYVDWGEPLTTAAVREAREDAASTSGWTGW